MNLGKDESLVIAFLYEIRINPKPQAPKILLPALVAHPSGPKMTFRDTPPHNWTIL